jgi:hypothetical protein
MLHSHYQQLSADPNSLANLDQGALVSFPGECTLVLALTIYLRLPNNLQGHVPIVGSISCWLILDCLLLRSQFSLHED